MTLLLKNATFANWQTLEISRQNILVSEDDESLHLVTEEDAAGIHSDATVIDCSRKLVTKSFAVGHHHAYSALSRGMPPPKEQPRNFTEILKNIWWTLDKCLDKEITEASALVTAIACVRSGSTFVIDHHASPRSVRGSLETIAAAFEKAGVSHLLCYEISDRDGMETAIEGLAETDDYLKKHQGLVGLHASFTVGNETLREAVSLMRRHNSGIHIHVAEDKWDQDHCLKTYSKRVVERLHEAGVMDSTKTLLVHCLHLNSYERDLIKNSGVWVAENSESNLNNNVGFFNGADLGRNILLGTDGMHGDMLRSARVAFFSGRKYDDISCASAYERMRNVHRYLESGGFSGDGDNNLVILDYDPPAPLSHENFAGHFVFGLDSSQVSDVIAGGKLIMRDRKILTVDEASVMANARELAGTLWKRMSGI